MHLSSNTMLFISTPIWVLVFCFFFPCNFYLEWIPPTVHSGGGISRKLVTEEKEDEEPGDSPGHFLQKCVSRQAEPSREAGCHSAAPFTKDSGWRGQKHHVWPFSAETLPHPWPNRKVKGESLRQHIHTLISKALLLFFWSICSFSSHSGNCRGKETWLLVFNIIGLNCSVCRASLVARTVKNPPAMQEAWVRSLGQEDPLEKETATHSSIFAWRMPWTEEPGGLQSKESKRAGCN